MIININDMVLDIHNSKNSNFLNEYKVLNNWILSWYIENHLKFNSLNSLKDSDINKYINKSNKMVTLISNNIPNINIYLDSLDKIIFDKVPESFIKNNKTIEYMC